MVVQGYVAAVRCDDRVQVYPDRFNFPKEDLLWRPRSLVALTDTEHNFSSNPPTDGLKHSLATPSTPYKIEPQSEYKVFVKNLKKGLQEEQIRFDFDADKVLMPSRTSAVLIFASLAAAETALSWNRTTYKGLILSVDWSH